MGVLNINHIPTIIDSTFYRYNYIDYRMWAQIKNQLDYRDMGENSILISKEQLKVFIESNYRSEINKIASYGANVPKKDATTVYFMYRVVHEMVNLRYLKLTLDSDKAFSRITKDADGEDSIKYDFAILKARLDISDIFNFPELNKLNAVLEEVGLLNEGVPFVNCTANDIFDRLDIYLAENAENKSTLEFQMVTALLDALEASLEKENPIVLLITDYS